MMLEEKISNEFQRYFLSMMATRIIFLHIQMKSKLKSR